eukprot:scpid106020/ scgid25405/ 
MRRPTFTHAVGLTALLLVVATADTAVVNAAAPDPSRCCACPQAYVNGSNCYTPYHLPRNITVIAKAGGKSIPITGYTVLNVSKDGNPNVTLTINASLAQAKEANVTHHEYIVYTEVTQNNHSDKEYCDKLVDNIALTYDQLVNGTYSIRVAIFQEREHMCRILGNIVVRSNAVTSLPCALLTLLSLLMAAAA